MTGARPPATAGMGLAVALAVASVALGALPRVLLAMDALPDALRPFVWSDVLHIWERGARDGALPYRDVFFEYPPLLGYAWAALELVARTAPAHVIAWAVVQSAAAGVVALVLARESSPRASMIFWSLSPQLLLFGALNFDVIALAALVLALALARRGRTSPALVALTAGALLKVFPVVAVPLLLEQLRRRRGIAAALGGGALVTALALGVAAPSLLAPFSSAGGLSFVGGLTNIDSVWGLVTAVLSSAGLPAAGAVAAASIAGLTLTYAAVLRRADERADPSHLALLGLLAVMLWTRLYSPQYALWVLPFFALLALPLRVYLLLALADVAVFASVYPLTLRPWQVSDPLPPLLLGALAAGVVLRHAALIALWRSALRAPPST